MNKIKSVSFILVMCIFLLASDMSFAMRGCCSWHGGVASCDTDIGRLVCRDGTYSPSCLCERVEKSEQAEEDNDVIR